MEIIVQQEIVEGKIFIIRGHRVMLSTDLAELYGVAPKVLVQAVKRNKERFPEDFMFQLTNQEVINLKSQTVTSSWGGVRRANPYAFTVPQYHRAAVPQGNSTTDGKTRRRSNGEL